jgi:branched-chain amino acid transport system substrate-binding protein
VSATEAGKEFEKRYNAVYSDPYEQNGPYAYDTAGVILEALAAVGPDKQALVDYIASHDYEGVVGTIHFDDHGQNVSGGLTMYVNQDGRWVRWVDSDYSAGSRPLPWK